MEISELIDKLPEDVKALGSPSHRNRDHYNYEFEDYKVHIGILTLENEKHRVYEKVHDKPAHIFALVDNVDWFYDTTKNFWDSKWEYDNKKH